MLNIVANLFENLKFNISTGGLSDRDAFLLYGLVSVLVYHISMNRNTKKIDTKMYGIILVAAGALGIISNRYRKAALGAREEIYADKGLSKDTAFLAGQIRGGSMGYANMR
jgi:hypothetical protein